MRLERRALGQEEIRRRLEILGALLLIGALISVLHLFGARICLFRRLTGLPCLTCGTSRAFAALLRGDLADAFSIQPLAVSCAVALCVAALIQSWFVLRDRTVLVLRVGRRERVALAVAAVLLLIANWAWLVYSGV